MSEISPSPADTTGRIERGSTGFIGTDKSCAQETVKQLADDFDGGKLSEPARDASEFDRLVRARRPQARFFAGAAPRRSGLEGLFAGRSTTDPAV